MALSNMIREPRRELTETALGVLIAAPFIVAAYYFGLWFVASIPALAHVENPLLQILCQLLGMAVGAVCIAIGSFGLVIIHETGEDFCNAMERRGVHLRPRERR